jgi:hypothetical protein
MLDGLLVETRRYELGVDPLTQSDNDTEPGTCETCSTPHPFAPYLPAHVGEFETRPLVVRVDCLPNRPCLVSQQ